MTPRQFSFAVERHQERYKDREKRADRRAGGVIAMLHNIHFRSAETDPLLDWQDFFREWKEPLEPVPEQTEEQMFESMKLLAASTGGIEPST